MRRFCILLLSVLAINCDYNFTAPSPVVNVNVNNTNNNANNNNNDNDNTLNPGPGGSGNTTPTNPTGPRVPDPTTGVILPLLATAQTTITTLGNQNASLVQQCSHAFIDALLNSLRLQDTRWGYVCKYGQCSDISLDVIAYHATAGPDVRGATGTYEIDVIGASCSPTATPQFLNYGFGSTNVFSPTR